MIVNPTTTNTIEIRFVYDMNNAWFVSFLMWVHHLIDDILDDQDWIVHLVNITFVIWVVEHFDQP
jgi:hypothetical protein